MEKAIKIAEKGGWKWFGSNEVDFLHGQINFYNVAKGFPSAVTVAEICMDISFWQCLGKAEDWDNCDDGICIETMDFVPRNPAFLSDCSCHRKPCLRWDLAMHRFIDHLIEGKPVDEFFNKLLKSND